MKILHINMSSRGVGQYGKCLAEGLNQLKETEIFNLFNIDSISSSSEQLKSLKYTTFSMKTSANKLFFLFKLNKIIKKYKPDIIHDSAGSSTMIGLMMWPLIRIKKIPLIVTEHDPIPHSGMGYKLSSKANRKVLHQSASTLIVHGPKCRSELELNGLESHKIEVVRHGHYGLYDFSKEKIERRENEILFFGALRPNKGVEYLKEIALKVNTHFPNVKFVVAGSPKVSPDLQKSSWSDKLKDILDDLKSNKNFDIHDRFIPDEEVEYFFKRAGITIMPYLDATQSGVAMIAMPLESVVLATDVGDIPYVIENGKNGFLSKPNANEFAEKLIEVLKSPDEISNVRKNAKEFVVKECDWIKIANSLREIYKNNLY